MIFTRDVVTRENQCRITSLVTKKIVIHGNSCIILYYLFMLGLKLIPVSKRGYWWLYGMCSIVGFLHGNSVRIRTESCSRPDAQWLGTARSHAKLLCTSVETSSDFRPDINDIHQMETIPYNSPDAPTSEIGTIVLGIRKLSQYMFTW